jgi:transcriptional regulator of heat shock response
MDKKTVNELDNLVDSYFSQKDIEEESKEKRKQAAENTRSEFLEACDNVIEPAFQEISQQLKKKGVVSRISREQPHSINLTQQGHHSIEIVFLTDKDTFDRSQFPRFCVILDQSQNTVRFHQSTITPKRGGTSGSIGSVKLSEMTKELIQSKVLALLKEVLR